MSSERYESWSSEPYVSWLDEIKSLVASGVLGSEECPEPRYWHWQVLKPEELPERFKWDFQNYGEVRCYFTEDGPVARYGRE